MKWVRDTTGRFSKRPHYLPDEIDTECERIVREFLLGKYARVEYPISTDDLTILLERDVEDLDMYADFSDEDGQIEGVTEFRLGKKPRVKIAARLANTPNLENRLRTTLTHEYGHVKFHDLLYQVEVKPASLFEPPRSPQELGGQAHRCKRDSMLSLSERDWMEWQAGYVCGAMLIPVQPLVRCVQGVREKLGLPHSAISEAGPEGAALTDAVARDFQTSKNAAKVRLLQKRMLQPGAGQSLLLER